MVKELIREAIEHIELAESALEEAYKKTDNPLFRDLMDRLYSIRYELEKMC